jgi:hypothetical protein
MVCSLAEIAVLVSKEGFVAVIWMVRRRIGIKEDWQEGFSREQGKHWLPF